MTKAIINATIYTGQEVIESGFIVFEDKILQVGTMEEYSFSLKDVIDAKGKTIIPGMIDIHIHGGYTVDAMDADANKLVQMSEQLVKEGVTTFFPTTMTQSIDNITNALRGIAAAKKQGANIGGIHLEGPFVNVEKAGAQPHEYIIDPSIQQFDEWQEAAEGLIKLVTYAPEKDDNGDFQKHLVGQQVVASAGHTDATSELLKQRNVKHFTHLFNQMRGLHHREPGTAGYAILSEDAYVEMIVDGIHVHPEMIRLAYKVKGADRICVITDAMRAKGLEDGAYELGGQPVMLKGQEVRLADGTLAGSALTMDAAFKNMIRFTGCSIEEAVRMTSVNQAKEFGLHNKGGIAPNKDSDFIIMDEQLNITNTFTMGRNVVVK